MLIKLLNRYKRNVYHMNTYVYVYLTSETVHRDHFLWQKKIEPTWFTLFICCKLSLFAREKSEHTDKRYHEFGMHVKEYREFGLKAHYTTWRLLEKRPQVSMQTDYIDLKLICFQSLCQTLCGIHIITSTDVHVFIFCHNSIIISTRYLPSYDDIIIRYKKYRNIHFMFYL